MEKQENRVERWIAYFLGDLDAANAAVVEAKMKAMPEEALEIQNTVEGIRAWSSEPVPHLPLDMDDLGIEQLTHRPERTSASGMRFRMSSFWVRSGMLVAASVMLLALTQVQFSLSLGDSTFSWGMDENRDVIAYPAQAELEAAATSLVSRIELLERAASEMEDAVEALAFQDSMMAEWFKQNTLELARYQRLESKARLRDMQRMMTWTDYPEALEVTLASDIASQIGLRSGRE